MSDWLVFVGVVLALTGALLLLAIPALLALKVRGFTALMLAFPISLAVIGIATVLAPVVGLEWSVLVVAASAALIGVVLYPLGRRWVLRTPADVPHRPLKWPIIGILAAGAIIGGAFVLALPNAAAISQTYDAVFHLNAVQYILDTGSASPLDMDLTSPGQASPYPTLWHALVSLVVQITGVSIPLATNAVTFVTIAIIWPVGAVALGRAVAGPSPLVTVVSAAAATAFPNLPLSLTAFGVLYPNLLSTVLIPFIFVAVLQIFDAAEARQADPLPAATRWLMLVGTLCAAMLAHPNALHVTLIVIAPFAILSLARTFQQGSTLQRMFHTFLFVAYVGGSFCLWYFVRAGINPWTGKHGPVGALLDAFGTTPHLAGHNWLIALLALVGLVTAVRSPRLRGFVGVLVLLVSLYVLADGFAPFKLRSFILNPWYSDPWRLASLIPIALIPLTVIGARSLSSHLLPGLRKFTEHVLALSWSRGGRVFAALLLFAAFSGAALAPVTSYITNQYAESSSSKLLSVDERALLERLDAHIEEDAVIMNNPWNGSALAYAFSGRMVLFPHMGGRYGQERYDALEGIAFAGPLACDRANELGARYVLDFGEVYIFSNTEVADGHAAVSSIESAPGLTEIDREGNAVLYEITGCPTVPR